MTAHSSVAKRRVVVRRKKSQTRSPYPQIVPEKPPVDKGPKCYGRTKKGKYVVVRFWIYESTRENSRLIPGYQIGKFWVVDMDEPDLRCARGTRKDGYESLKKAVKVAKQYRDEFGAWTKVKF